MENELSIEIKRFKKLRESLNETQQSFAEKLGIKGSTADIERGKSKITGSVVAELLKQFKINPLWLFGKSFQQFLDTSQNVAPKVVTVDGNDSENMVLVNIKAAAGYPHNIVDVDWYKQLPAFDLPLPEYRNATYRGFQVDGDSMIPSLYPKEWVLAKAVSSIDDLNKNTICVVIMKDSVLVKKIQRSDDPSKLMLVSINTEYPPVQINIVDIQELWQVTSKLTFNIDTDASPNSLLIQLQESMDKLKKDISELKS
ncbi:MAG: LexA family transcriptional regulator [Bacteroidia bacterium]|nr:LexA family transcriptional regulator [Bacteroidia bacterium]MBT8310774.1 LexA family transcriptional regulator [Bacteroidia bacterium]NNK27694.1 LexA family transcriptional regulator [Flavobacteriaceae bacterium]NNL59782.1 LexA family transcriptional regulator [Flavobacteriaceae bacterium]